MNMIKKNGGFTLIELIVVIAILAILAGVAVPAYSAYIDNANKSADNQEIAAIETAMASALAMAGKNNSDVAKYFKTSYADSKLTVAKQDTGAASDVETVWKNFTTFYGNATCEITLKYYDSLSGDKAVPKLLDGATATCNHTYEQVSGKEEHKCKYCDTAAVACTDVTKTDNKCDICDGAMK